LFTLVEKGVERIDNLTGLAKKKFLRALGLIGGFQMVSESIGGPIREGGRKSSARTYPRLPIYMSGGPHEKKAKHGRMK